MIAPRFEVVEFGAYDEIACKEGLDILQEYIPDAELSWVANQGILFSKRCLARYAGQSIGVVLMNTYNSRHTPVSNSVRIDLFVVTEDKRGAGFGHLILDSVEQELAKEGFKHVNVHSDKDALEFYKDNGYDVIPGSDNPQWVGKHLEVVD